jgi:hypothetical protein
VVRLPFRDVLPFSFSLVELSHDIHTDPLSCLDKRVVDIDAIVLRLVLDGLEPPQIPVGAALAEAVVARGSVHVADHVMMGKSLLESRDDW